MTTIGNPGVALIPARVSTAILKHTTMNQTQPKREIVRDSLMFLINKVRIAEKKVNTYNSAAS